MAGTWPPVRKSTRNEPSPWRGGSVLTRGPVGRGQATPRFPDRPTRMPPDGAPAVRERPANLSTPAFGDAADGKFAPARERAAESAVRPRRVAAVRGAGVVGGCVASGTPGPRGRRAFSAPAPTAVSAWPPPGLRPPAVVASPTAVEVVDVDDERPPRGSSSARSGVGSRPRPGWRRCLHAAMSSSRSARSRSAGRARSPTCRFRPKVDEGVLAALADRRRAERGAKRPAASPMPAPKSRRDPPRGAGGGGEEPFGIKARLLRRGGSRGSCGRIWRPAPRFPLKGPIPGYAPRRCNAHAGGAWSTAAAAIGSTPSGRGRAQRPQS
jgi:hypothetical protein